MVEHSANTPTKQEVGIWSNDNLLARHKVGYETCNVSLAESTLVSMGTKRGSA
jgi:hypothetical protein